MDKHLHFGLIHPEEIVQEILWFVQRQLCKHKHAAIFFLDKRAFLLETLQNKQYLFSVFSNCAVMNLKIQHGK